MVLGAAAVHAQQSSSGVVIQEPITIKVPLAPCAAGSIAHRILSSTRQLGGIEFATDPCGVWSPRQPPAPPAQPRPDDVPLQGLTVREALDRLVAADPRYRWMESNGLIVMRPSEAWNDPHNVLHRTIDALELKDDTFYGALAAIQSAIGPVRIGSDGFVPRTPESERRVSLRLGVTSVFDALNAVVRAHGALQWSVVYCHAPTRYENASIGFSTFDGGGGGGHAVFLRDADGKSYDPCR